MNELYFAKGKAPEIDASKWKVLPSRRTFESPFTSVAPNPLHIFLQGVESAINTEAPESSAPSDSLTDDEKCLPHPPLQHWPMPLALSRLTTFAPCR